ncbi:MAG: cytochrome c [Vicinamibacterales bacterium]
MRVLLALPLLAALACNANPGEGILDFERMRAQPRYDAYEHSRYFADGMTMRRPPEGSIAIEDANVPVPLQTEDWNRVSTVPVGVTTELMIRGRGRYDVFCRPCHDVDGTGGSPVASAMQLRKPPSLLEARVRALPVGRLYQAIAQGYGLMPSYARQLQERDRWAVVAYVRALQLRSAIAVDALPPPLRIEALRALRGEAER